ncbi:hypothetical protein Tco_1174078 [Tanacetum coccineum]
METQVPTTEEEGFGIRLDTEHSDCISFSDTTTNDETETDESDGDDDEANGTSELISYDGSSGKEKPIDESYDPN